MQKKTQQYGHGGGRGEQAQPDAWPRSGREGGGRETGRRGPSEGTRPRQESLSRWEGEGGPTPSGHDERDWQRAERAPQEARQGWERDAQFGRPGADARGTRTRDGAWAPDAPVGAYGHDAEGAVYGGDGARERALRGFGEGPDYGGPGGHGRGMQHEGANLAGYGHAYHDGTARLAPPGFGGQAYGPAYGSGGFDGPHRGKGPKGYRRADDRIREEICELIARQGRVDASDVEVRVDQGEVVLTGTVASREDKRALEDLVEHVHGVEDVRNELRRTRASTTDAQASSAQVTRGGGAREAKNGVDSSRSFPS